MWKSIWQSLTFFDDKKKVSESLNGWKHPSSNEENLYLKKLLMISGNTVR